MNWTPPPETHRVDATTESSGRIQDEPASVQPQDSIFQMPTEAELDEFLLSLGLEPPIQPQDMPPPEEPQTLPHPSRGPLTLAAELDALLSGRIDIKDIFFSLDAITDSSGRIQDEPATVQPQDSVFQMPMPQHPDTPRPFTEAELDEFREDSSGRFHINDIFSSLGLEPPIQPQDVPPPEESQTLPCPSRGPLTLAELDALLPGRIDIKDIFLSLDAITDSSGRIQDEPVTVQPQDSIFQMPSPQHHDTPDPLTEAELDEPIFLQPQDVPPPEEPEPLPPPLTEAEQYEFRDSLGRLDYNAMFLSQGLEPINYAPSPEEPQTRPRPLTPRPLTEAELDEFRDSSGRLDFDAMFLSQGLDPADYAPPPRPLTPRPLTEAELEPIDYAPPPEEPETRPRPLTPRPLTEADAPPPEEPETRPRLRMPRPLTQAELDEFRDSSGRLDLDAMFLSQGLDPADYAPPPKEPQSKGLSKETISKYLKKMNADEIRAHDKDGDRRICAVCLDDVCRQKDIVAILDDCGHEFHYCCLEKWLRRKNICPLCRRTAIFLLGDD